MTAGVAGIVCALSTEARHLRIACPRADRLATLDDGSLLSVSGMGAQAAARGARALVAAGAQALASFGLAGGLDPTLAAGDIFVPEEVVVPSDTTIDSAQVATAPLAAAPIVAVRITTARQWRERLAAALAAYRPIANGALLSSASAVATIERKAQLFRSTAARAVDMESGAIAQVAAVHGLPFVAVRVIVDGAGDALPRAVASAADEAGQLRLWRLIGALARSPADLPPLLQLARRYRVASRSLSAVGRSGALAGALP